MRYRKKPVEIEAHQWFQNGDHPLDKVGEMAVDPLTGVDYERLEGDLVRYFRRPEPEYAGDKAHDPCGRIWHDHGWIDTLEGGHTVCPGDWIITGVQGEHYPCKPDIFDATYDPVPCSRCAGSGWTGNRQTGPGMRHYHCPCGRPCRACGPEAVPDAT